MKANVEKFYSFLFYWSNEHLANISAEKEVYFGIDAMF